MMDTRENLKLSVYNSFLPLSNNKLAIFNARYNEFIIIDNRYKKIFDQKDVTLIKAELPGLLYQELIDKKFILGQNFNEVKDLKDYRKHLYEDDTKFTLVVNPTVSCNLDCWYCYESKVKSKMSEINTQATEKFIEKTISGTKNLKKFEMSFFGGEPLMYYKRVVKSLMEKTDEMCTKTGVRPFYGFTTNGVLITDKMIEEFAKYPFIGFQITLDGHEKHHNETRFTKNGKGTYAKIVSNVKKLSAHDNFHITLRFNCTKDNINNLADVLTDLSDINETQKKNITVAFEQVWQDFKNGNLTKRLSDLKDEFAAAGYFISDLDNAIAPRWCDGNRKHSAVINYNGEVFKCTARDFNSDTKEGVLAANGDVQWDPKQIDKRYDALFASDLCYNCRIAPVCTERCAQKNIEDGKHRCVYKESQKDDVVRNKLYYFICNQEKVS